MNRKKSTRIYHISLCFQRFIAVFAAAAFLYQCVPTENQIPISQAAYEETETAADVSGVSDTSAADKAGDDLSLSDAHITVPDSHREIYDILYEQFYTDLDGNSYAESGMRLFDAGTGQDIAYNEAAVLYSIEDSAMDTLSGGSSSADTSSSEAASSVDFSETNVQEQGVDEADIIKTDGEYIYILREDLSLAIVKAQGGVPQTVSITSLPSGGDGSIHEMYLEEKTLYLILTEVSSNLIEDSDTYYTKTGRSTLLLTYDISDCSSPALLGTVRQDGSYADSRKNGDFIYLFTRYTPDIRSTYEDSCIAPAVNGQTVKASDFFLPESLGDTSYLVISSVSADTPDKICETKVLVSGGSQFYVSQENIYIANEIYSESPMITSLTRFHYTDGQITGAAAGSFKGYLNNSFSMNEYNGYLRVAATSVDDDWNEQNALYILDGALSQVGSIENLAEGEIIRSARFFGDAGYFVTFQQTDPLFSVDLSDPENPRILGELKVSGFSSYLHFYGKNQLLGIGYEADESTGAATGLKLSMFDISDRSDVKETARLVIPGITWCPSIDNYKSILVDPDKNLIGFYCDNRYLVYSYGEDSGFTQEMIYDFYRDGLAGAADCYTMRGLYIADSLYLAGNSFVISFDMADGFRQTALLGLER